MNRKGSNPPAPPRHLRPPPGPNPPCAPRKRGKKTKEQHILRIRRILRKYAGYYAWNEEPRGDATDALIALDALEAELNCEM